MKVLLLGCGMTGGAIALRLAKENSMELIGLYNRTFKDALLLEKKISSPKVKALEQLYTISDYDYILVALSGISAADRKDSFFNLENNYQVRQAELKYNIKAVAGLVETLKKAKSSSKIIVITNPVEEITNYLRLVLNKKEVFGFGLDLDAKRYSKIIGHKVTCIGTHGKAVPLLNLKSNIEYESIYQKTDEELMKYVRRNGIPYGAAGDAFMEFFSKFNSLKPEVIHISAYIKNSLFGVSGLCISTPWRVKKGKLISMKKIKANKIEKERFRESARELKRSVEHIVKTRAKIISLN